MYLLTQSDTKEEQKTRMDRPVGNDANRLKPKGCLVADVHRSKGKSNTTNATGKLNVRSMNKGNPVFSIYATD